MPSISLAQRPFSALLGTPASWGRPQLSRTGLEALLCGPESWPTHRCHLSTHVLLAFRSSPTLPQCQQLLKDPGDTLFFSVSCPKETQMHG